MNHPRTLNKAVAALTGACGVALMFASFGISHTWVVQHFLPDFSMSLHARALRVDVLSLAIFAAGAGVLASAVRLARRASKRQTSVRVGSILRIALAVLLAGCASEALLRTAFAELFDEVHRRHPPRAPDDELGWKNRPGSVDRVASDGREVVYTMDSDGNRVEGQGASISQDQPVILLTGESFAIGYGLPWQNTIAASLETLSHTPVVDVAVAGYSLSQSFMRLKQQLPRVDHPVAVISFVVPSVFKKMLDRNRPQLTPTLTWRPREQPLRLAMAAHWLVPYDSTREIDRAVATARAVLHATDTLARAQGARSIIVVPQFMPEEPGEKYVRQRVLDEGGLPYVLVPLAAEWRLRDGHPDPRGATAIAEAIARELGRPANRAQ